MSLLENLKNIQDISTDNCCLICQMEMTDNNRIKIECNHEFHYECIKKWYIKTFQRGIAKTIKRECPYCRKSGGFLPYKEGEIFDKRIHNIENISKNNIYIRCKAIKKNGEQCKLNSINEKYCYLHEKYLNKNHN